MVENHTIRSHPQQESGLFFPFFETSGLFFSIFENKPKVHIIFHKTGSAMTTPVPPGIASPDTIKTRLGLLKFFDGFPDDSSVEKIFDNLDFQRAVQAYLLGLAPEPGCKPQRNP